MRTLATIAYHNLTLAEDKKFIITELCNHKGAEDEETIMSSVLYAHTTRSDEALLCGIRIYQNSKVERVFVAAGTGGFWISYVGDLELEEDILNLDPKLTATELIGGAFETV